MSSLQATCVNPLTALPVYTARTVSKLLPTVLIVAVPPLAGVHRYHTVLPIPAVAPPHPKTVGSPASTVAPAVFAVNCAGTDDTVVALAKLSLPGTGTDVSVGGTV